MTTASGTSSPRVHVASCATQPELGPGLARGAQDVAGRDVRQAEVLGQQRGLRALAGAGRAEQDQIEFGHEVGSGARAAAARGPRGPAAARG